LPISATAFLRSTVLLFLIGVIALVGIVGTTFWLVAQNEAWFNETTQARIARTSTVALRNALQEVETGQRGFLLTEDENYLNAYSLSLPEIPGLLDLLDNTLAPYPDLDDQQARIRSDIESKLEEIQETVALTRAGRVDEAIAIVRTNQGKMRMNDVRQQFDLIINEVDLRIVEGIENQRNATAALRWVTITSALVIFAVAGAAFWTVQRYTRELAQARHEVDLANAGLEEKVRERTSELGRANEEIQRFAYIVTHDLRAPLVNVMGFTSELETSVGDLRRYMENKSDDGDINFADAKIAATEDLPEAVSFIRAATRKMDGLINAILKISREGRRQLRPETLDLAAIVQATTASVHHQLADNSGDAQIDVRVPPIVSDKLSIEQILGNLLDNAIKYREPSRPLAITIRAAPTTNNRIQIDVIDNGRGIADTDHERIFELFRRSGLQTQPGEGIGLAHVRTMVRSLGGDITLASKLGEGTTFTIDLPRDLRSYIRS
jgi:signal transduction histidine kinase